MGNEILRRNGSEFWVNRAIQNVSYRSQVGWANFNSLDLVLLFATTNISIIDVIFKGVEMR